MKLRVYVSEKSMMVPEAKGHPYAGRLTRRHKETPVWVLDHETRDLSSYCFWDNSTVLQIDPHLTVLHSCHQGHPGDMECYLVIHVAFL